MGFIAAGLAAVAVGGALQAKGASDSAKATANAYSAGIQGEQDFYDDQTGSLNKLIRRKTKKLNDAGNIFSRMESSGAFGDTNTLRDLRKAQSDFASLAAGDFSGFESQLKKNLSDSLIGVTDSGSPIGTYAGMAADTQLAMRKDGINTAMGITEFLSNETNKLLGQEFGIMDQKFNTGYEMGRTRLTNINNALVGKAGTVGVGTSAWGGALANAGAGVASAGISGAWGGGTASSVMGNGGNLIANHNASDRPGSPSTYNPSPQQFQSFSQNRAPTSYAGIPTPSYSPGYSPEYNLPDLGGSGLPSTIYPSDPMYNGFANPGYVDDNPFKNYSSGYSPSPYPNQQAVSNDFGVLPPLSAYNSASSVMGSVGAQFYRA